MGAIWDTIDRGHASNDCGHEETIHDVTPSARGCEECLVRNQGNGLGDARDYKAAEICVPGRP